MKNKSLAIIIVGIIVTGFGAIAYSYPNVFILGSREGAGFVANSVPEEVTPNETFRPEMYVSSGTNAEAVFDVNLDGQVVNSGTIYREDWVSGYYSYTYHEQFSVTAPNESGNYVLKVAVQQGDSSWTGSTNGEFTVTSEPKYSVSLNADPSYVGIVSLEPYQDKYEPNTEVTVSANVLSQYEGAYEFDHWSGDITGSENPKVITVNSNMYITAIFTETGDGGDGDVTGPSADFSYEPASPKMGEEISFDASISKTGDADSITSYTWNMGDGTTMSGKNINHTYKDSGKKNVTLTVTASNGKTDSITKTITVKHVNDPAARFDYDKPVIEGESVTFDATGSEPISQSVLVESYEWNFGDGTTAKGEEVTHTFDTVGTYGVQLKVTTNIGTTDTIIKQVEVQDSKFGISKNMALIILAVGFLVTIAGTVWYRWEG